MSRRVAVSVKSDEGIESIIDTRFSCAQEVLIIDSDTRKIIDRQKSGATLNGVSAVISGRFGLRTYQALTQNQIEMWIAGDGMTIEEALDRLAAGTLQRCTKADVGMGAGSKEQRTLKRWFKKYKARKRQFI